MKVRFSPDAFRFQRFGGVSRYFLELHLGLLDRDVDSAIVGGLHINQLIAGHRAVRGVDMSRVRPERARQAVTRSSSILLAWSRPLG